MPMPERESNCCAAELAARVSPAPAGRAGAALSALDGRRILVTRPAAQAAGLAAAVSARGGVPIAVPLIDIVSPAAPAAAFEHLASIADYAMAIFVSRNAVARGVAMLSSTPGADPARPVPAAVRVLAVGAGTARDLERWGVPAVSVPGERYDSEALLALETLAPASVGGAAVLIVKGEGGRDHLRRVLEARGARVDTAEVYARACPADGAKALAAAWRPRAPDAVVLTSVESTDNLFTLARDLGAVRAGLARAAYVVVSRRVAEALAAHAPGARLVVARQANDHALVDAACELFPGGEGADGP